MQLDPQHCPPDVTLFSRLAFRTFTDCCLVCVGEPLFDSGVCLVLLSDTPIEDVHDAILCRHNVALDARVRLSGVLLQTQETNALTPCLSATQANVHFGLSFVRVWHLPAVYNGFRGLFLVLARTTLLHNPTNLSPHIVSSHLSLNSHHPRIFDVGQYHRSKGDPRASVLPVSGAEDSCGH